MQGLSRPGRLLLAGLACLCWVAGSRGASLQTARASQQPSSFASRIAELSEPGGYFDTDNLISNERSYLQVAPELRALAPQGSRDGVYLGVGPDQNFSYIAQTLPSLAIVIDIRRDNLLLHLLFKALFAEARTRVEYLALLTGRSPPEPLAGWEQRPIDAIVAYIDGARRLPDDRLTALRARTQQTIRGFGVPMTDAERATIDNFHRRFIADGLALQFNTAGRAPQFDYPTYRDLLLEVDRQRAHQSFVATESDFQFVKGLQARDLVIPIVGNLAGPAAIKAVARFLSSTNRQVTAFYTSNVEFYLFRDGSFPRFAANLGMLPHQPGSVIVRSVFPSGRTGLAMPPGYNSASITQPIQALLDGYTKGQFRQYADLIR